MLARPRQEFGQPVYAAGPSHPVMTGRGLSRRRLLLAAGGGATAVAGCLGGGRPAGGEPGEGTPDSSPTGDTGGGTGLGDHPAADGIDAQPFLGPPPGEATATVVAFEDPSCTRCRAFERNAVPRLRDELVDPGRATFVFRGYPIVYPWGEPASRALEATFAADADAHWALADHYFAEQPAFDADNVLERTRAFLDAETDVDGASVVAAVEAGEADDAVRLDLDAGEAAGVSITPTVYLFRDGAFRTKAQGSVSYGTIEAALGL